MLVTCTHVQIDSNIKFLLYLYKRTSVRYRLFYTSIMQYGYKYCIVQYVDEYWYLLKWITDDHEVQKLIITIENMLVLIFASCCLCMQ